MKDREREKKRSQDYRKNNKASVKAYQRQYKAANKAKIAEVSRRYREANRDKIAEARKKTRGEAITPNSMPVVTPAAAGVTRRRWRRLQQRGKQYVRRWGEQPREWQPTHDTRGQNAVGLGASTAAGLQVGKSLQGQGAQMNDRDEKYPSAEDEPPMKVKKGDKHTRTATSVCMLGAKGAAQGARPRQKGHGRSDADSSATVAMGATDHECPPAATQARLRGQARPWKSTADAETEGHARSKADSSAAMATGDGFVDGHRPRIAPWILQRLIAALVSAEPCSQGSQGRLQ